MDEMTDQMKESLQKILPQIKDLICDEADKCTTNKKEYFDFVLSCATNLVGNLTWQACGHDVEKLQRLANVTLNNLIRWFAATIDYEKRQKEAH